jgi:hypothetical protein
VNNKSERKPAGNEQKLVNGKKPGNERNEQKSGNEKNGGNEKKPGTGNKASSKKPSRISWFRSG